MNKKFFVFILLLSIIIAGCGRAVEEGELLAKANNYRITKDKFEQEFKESMYGLVDTPQARKQFLDNLITRKLILQDAQDKDFDKEPGFLRMIERFWEQSLLKIALDKKAEEISGSISISDQMVLEAYEMMPEDEKINQPYEQISEQLKAELVNSEETQAMNVWITELNDRAEIAINEELLK